MMELAALQEYLTSRTKIDLSDIKVDAGILEKLGMSSDVLTYGEDGAAHIRMEGPLTPNGPDLLDVIMGVGGTSYKSVIEAVQKAEARFADEEDAATPIYLHVNSPGGLVSGAEATAAAVASAAAKRPLIAINEGALASAALWVASGATEIRSAGRSTWTGSVGAVMTVEKPDTGELKVFDFVNPESVDKVPDPETDAGAAVYEERVRAMYTIFRDDLLAGRGDRTTKEKVEALKGTVVTAPDAIKAGLIDSIIGNAVDIERTPVAIAGNMDGVSGDSETGREENMNLKECLAKYPALKAEIDALALQARSEGKAEALTEQSEIVAKLKPFMEGDTYPKRVQVACAGAIAGTRSVDSVLDLVAIFDEIKGQEEAEASAEEEEEIPGVPSATPVENAPKAADDGWNDSIKALMGIG